MFRHGRQKKTTVSISYNELLLPRGLNNVTKTVENYDSAALKWVLQDLAAINRC